VSKKTVELRPSRIRREPAPVEKKVDPRSDEQEVWFGAVGVVLVALTVAALTVGISVATHSKYDPAAAAEDVRFGQCYNGGPNCVLDGDTIYVGGEKVEIAGIEAPKIQTPGCPEERNRGIDSAVRLAELLNSGEVTVSAGSLDEYGRDVRQVQVNGHDVADSMISAGVSRRYDGRPQLWCS
jgi:endonuclease YncB( thermonuclease family)